MYSRSLTGYFLELSMSMSTQPSGQHVGIMQLSDAHMSQDALRVSPETKCQ